MLRWIVSLAALAAAMPASAGTGFEIESAVFVERASGDGLRVEPADRFVPGDRVVTVMTWQAPQSARYTIVTAVPAHLNLQSVSREGLQFSLDGGRSWRTLADGRAVPSGVTHLRWPAAGDGRLSYRAVVR